jgi:hypothetical protein
MLLKPISRVLEGTVSALVCEQSNLGKIACVAECKLYQLIIMTEYCLILPEILNKLETSLIVFILQSHALLTRPWS